MKRSGFSKFAVLARVLSLSTIVAAFDSQARQSNVYSLWVHTGPITGGSSSRLDREWTFGKVRNGFLFGFRQATQIDAWRDPADPVTTTNFEIWIAPHLFRIQIPDRTAPKPAIPRDKLHGGSIFLVGCSILASVTFLTRMWLNRNAKLTEKRACSP